MVACRDFSMMRIIRDVFINIKYDLEGAERYDRFNAIYVCGLTFATKYYSSR